MLNTIITLLFSESFTVFYEEYRDWIGTCVTALIVGIVVVLCEKYDKWLKGDNKPLPDKNKSKSTSQEH